MFIISILIFIAASLMGMLIGFELAAYVDIVSIILVLVPAIFFSIAATSYNDLMRGIAMLLSDKKPQTPVQLTLSKHSFRVLGNAALLLGIFSTLLGIIAIAGNLPAAEFSTAFGSAVAVCLLTLYYGVALKLICYVAEQKIQHKLILTTDAN